MSDNDAEHDLGPLPTVKEMNPWRKEFPRAIGTYWWFYGWLYGPTPGQGPTLTVVEIRGLGPEDDRRCVYVANGGFVCPNDPAGKMVGMWHRINMPTWPLPELETPK